MHRADDTPEAHNLLLTVVTAFVLVIFAPMLVFPEDPVPISFAFLAQFAVVAYAGTRLSMLIGRGQPMWYDTMFYAFAYVWMGLAGWAQVTSGKNPFHITHQPASQEIAAMITLVGMFSYDVGRVLSRRRASHGRSAAQPRLPRRLDRRRVWLLVVVSFVVTPLLIAKQGGWGSFLMPVNLHFAELTARGLYTPDSNVVGSLVESIARVLPFVALVAMLRLSQARPELRRRPAWWASVLALGLLNAITSNPVSSPRFWAGTVLLGLLLSTRWSVRRIGYRTIVCALLGSLIIFFPYADYFRNANPTYQQKAVSDFLVNKLDYDAPAQMVNAVDYRREIGGTDGRQLLGAMMFWVPRSVWPDKPGATGPLLGRFINASFLNISSPLWLETYLDGGYLLTILLFGGLGAVAARIDSQMDPRRRSGPTDLAIFALPVLSVHSIIMLRGSLLSNMGVFVVLAGTILLVTKRVRVPDSVTNPPAATRLPSPAAS